MKPASFTPKPGTNVLAKVDGEQIGPIYLVQIVDGMATLQGAKTHVIPVSDIIEEV